MKRLLEILNYLTKHRDTVDHLIALGEAMEEAKKGGRLDRVEYLHICYLSWLARGGDPISYRDVLELWNRIHNGHDEI